MHNCLQNRAWNYLSSLFLISPGCIYYLLSYHFCPFFEITNENNKYKPWHPTGRFSLVSPVPLLFFSEVSSCCDRSITKQNKKNQISWHICIDCSTLFPEWTKYRTIHRIHGSSRTVFKVTARYDEISLYC